MNSPLKPVHELRAGGAGIRLAVAGLLPLGCVVASSPDRQGIAYLRRLAQRQNSWQRQAALKS